MLMSLLRLFERLGAEVDTSLEVASDTTVDAVLQVRLDGARARFAVEVKPRAPYPSEIASMSALQERLRSLGAPLLVAPYISVSTGEALTEGRWSWADADGNADIRADGVRIQRRVSASPPKKRSTDLPTGVGSWAIIRSLITDGVVAGATAAAKRAGISQPRASQILARLTEANLVEREGRSLWRADREALLDALLSEYRGPGGETLWFYSLNPPGRVAEAAIESRVSHQTVVISGDVAADRLAPWRTPTQVTLYSTGEVNEDRLEVVAARGADDGNVEVIVPDDVSVFQDGWAGDLPIAHPTQVIWDLMRLGGSDREEAAERVRAWLLSH